MNNSTFYESIPSMSKQELVELIESEFIAPNPALEMKADELRRLYYGDKVFIRGLIEISNYCKNNCYYCGIRLGNKNINRYRLDKKTILHCVETGHMFGIQTFVLQGGEDGYFENDELLADIIYSIKNLYPDCAITLSLGERSRDSYQTLHNAGADRYLLRHETANNKHYKMLHPSNLSSDNRKKCLSNLKEIGFHVGAGFMVGSPYQTTENLAEDLLFIKELEPHMVGIGPFIPQKDTVFFDKSQGDLINTLTMLSVTRIMLPTLLLPSTTALGTISPIGRELGLKAGANVVMPNLSPKVNRKDYALYDNKIATNEEVIEGLPLLLEKIKQTGYTPCFERGDNINFGNNQY